MMRQKDRLGGAYITVLIAFLAILALILVPMALVVTSRDITSRYPYFSGLYDMAVAGNESAFFLAKDVLDSVMRDAHIPLESIQVYNENGVEQCLHPHYFFDENLVKEFDERITEAFSKYFNASSGGSRTWEISVSIELYDVFDKYVGSTSVVKTETGYRVRTVIRKFVNEVAGRAVIVESDLVWSVPNSGKRVINCLDYYVPTMLELMRISN